jgi:hypothetical protein
MANVVSVTLLHDERRTIETADGRQHTLSWHVLLDEAVINGSDIARTAQDPSTGMKIPVARPVPDAYYGDPFVVCQGISSQPVEGNRCLFKVTAQYGTIQGPPSDGGPSDNPDPLQRAPDISWSFETEPLFRSTDISGNPFVNSANFLFDPPPQIDRQILVLNVLINEATYNATLAYQYIGTINQSGGSILGFSFGEGEALCTAISGQRQYENGYTYWQVSYQFKFKASFTAIHKLANAPAAASSGIIPAWDHAVLDSGYYTRSVADGIQRIKDADDVEMQQPWPLDGAGGLLVPVSAGGGVIVNPVFIVFQVYERADFTAFNF